MDLKEFIESYGRDEAKLVAEKAGTIWQYVYQCAEGYRRPSVERAQKLVDAMGLQVHQEGRALLQMAVSLR